jgi:hypothetical protein
MSDLLQTEYEFELPLGYVDETGSRHRRGSMRLATAADEILPLRDPRVQANAGYHAVIVLSRVVTRLGTLQMLNTKVIEDLYSRDFAHLQRLYDQINLDGRGGQEAVCPKCEHHFPFAEADGGAP